MPDFSTLTDRQREIYDFIREKIENRGYGPTVRRDRSGLRHQVAQRRHVPFEGTGEKGSHYPRRLLARAIQLVDHRPQERSCRSWVWSRPASRWAAVQQEERLNFSDLFGGENHFALKVKGQSMIETTSTTGDYVVIRKQENAENGRARRGHDRQRDHAETLPS